MTADAVGGIWAYAAELAAALEAQGHDVVRVAIGPQAPPADDPVPHRRGLLEWQDEPWDDLAETGDWLLDLAERVQPDVVHLNSFSPGALPWGRPTVVAGHSCVLSWHEHVRGRPADDSWDPYRERVRRGLLAADAVVAPTAAMLDDLRRLYDLPPTTGRTIHNGIMSSRVPAPARKEPLVLAAGRLWDEAKGLDTLDRAAAAIAWPVELAGDCGTGGARHAHLLGVLPREALRERMGQAAIFAHPARYEPFGLVVLEAALAGCGLVLGDIATLRELWDEAALFVPPGDADALAEAVDRLTSDAALRGELAAAALERARRHDAHRMAEQYAALYESLPARTGAAA